MAHKRLLEDQSYSIKSKRKKIESAETPLTAPIVSLNKPKKWGCEVCGRAFSHRGHLNQHKLIHQERRFKCSFEDCGKLFCFKHQLTRHEITHSRTKEFPFACELKDCRFRSKLREYLEKHKARVHDCFGKYKCGICDRRFAKKRKLKEHSKKHTGIDPYDCPSCDRKFPTNRGMRKHFTSRHGKPKHKCVHCEQRFRNFTELRKHLSRQHQGFVCCFRHPGFDEVCGKKFKTSVLLTAHIEEMWSKKQAKAAQMQNLTSQTSLCTGCGNVYKYMGMRKHDCEAMQKRNMTYRGIFKANKHIGGWVARIKHHKVNFYLGRYNTAEEAARAYDVKAIELLGNKAQLNFRPECPPRNPVLSVIRKQQPGGEKSLRAVTSNLMKPPDLAEKLRKTVVAQQESSKSELSDSKRNKNPKLFSVKCAVLSSQSGTSCSEIDSKRRLVFSTC